MAKKKIFISSVQLEFATARKALNEYICADPLLGKFFEPFLFELLPASDQTADAVFLREVQFSDIYLGLFGKDYGFENKEGISPTEMEFNHATLHHITRLIFLTNDSERHPKEQNLIAKAQEVVVRKKFSTIDELKSAVYAALVNYLLEKEIIRSGPFDAAHAEKASYTDMDPVRVKQFVRLAQGRRGFPLNETEPIENIITHLNLGIDRKLTNASILLFGKEPQRFFINSEVRCASFLGTEVEKPIPSYKVFKGTVFELADQALEFVLNKLNYRIETRSEQISIPGSYEIPKEALSEAIVNGIAHRDYTSNASVQVMVFRDRVEIWNPGSLPMGWTTQKLKQLHTSVPANPLLAEPLYLAGYIERLGTGTTDIVKKCLASGLQEPQFIQAEDFKTILYRPSTDQVEEQVREQVEEQVRKQVRELVLTILNEMSAQEIMNVMNLKGRRNFLQNYLQPALGDAFIEMSQPDSPKSPTQKYRLTAKGKALKQQLKKKK
jgi:ATP-dependent DNA helicase RecG